MKYNKLNMEPDLVRIEPLPDRQLQLEYETGLNAIINLAPRFAHGRGVFEPLKASQDFFELVTIAPYQPNTICWPNQADIAAETLYDLALNSIIDKYR